jgi:hypothetical protein
MWNAANKLTIRCRSSEPRGSFCGEISNQTMDAIERCLIRRRLRGGLHTSPPCTSQAASTSAAVVEPLSFFVLRGAGRGAIGGSLFGGG